MLDISLSNFIHELYYRNFICTCYCVTNNASIRLYQPNFKMHDVHVLRSIYVTCASLQTTKNSKMPLVEINTHFPSYDTVFCIWYYVKLNFNNGNGSNNKFKDKKQTNY